MQIFTSQDLLLLEEQEGSVNFKFGVIYAKKGQTTDDEMLSNGKSMKSFNLNLTKTNRPTLETWTAMQKNGGRFRLKIKHVSSL